MIFEGFSVGFTDSNCYLIGCPATKQAAVVDPGAEGGRILERLKQLGLTCQYIILTHGHADHIGALNEVRQGTGAKVLIHKKDADMLVNPALNLSMFMGSPLQCDEADELLADVQKINLGELTLEVLFTPGHTPGGISLQIGDKLITGDTLFAGSIGRTDFPGGDHHTLINSIKTKLLPYPEATKVYPGHGPSSTIGDEKRSNPFL